VVAGFATHEAAESGIRQLYSTTGDRMKVWGKRGAFWGGIWGWRFGAALFMIPGVGQIAVAGPLVAGLVGALRGAAIVGGASALGGALSGLGLPKDAVIRYEAAIQADQFVAIAQGTEAEVTRARSILAGASPTTLDEHIAVAVRPRLLDARCECAVGRPMTPGSPGATARGGPSVQDRR